MPIGEEQAAVYCAPELNKGTLQKLLKRAYYRAYGHSDVHTHIRWRAVSALLPPELLQGRPNVLEVGCSSGIIAFEIARKCPNASILAVDADELVIKLANRAKDLEGVSNVAFRVLRVPGLESFAEESFDVVLLIDVIEHVPEDSALLKEIGRVLRPGGVAILSVPTPNYPRVFGRKFHELIGHVREGYWKKDLASLLEGAGLSPRDFRPYTYPCGALSCFLFYRGLSRLRPLPTLFSPLLTLFSWLDLAWPLRRESFACSLAATAVKPR